MSIALDTAAASFKATLRELGLSGEEPELGDALEYLMVYGDGGSARVVGLERVAGKLGGKEGTFVLEYHGGYADGTASGPVSVVEGSGTGALEGLRGQGTAIAKQDGTTSLNLDYDYS